jgi:serine phosphatase RsbU (regulator of sigma subunit)
MVRKGVARYLKIGGKPLGGEGVDFRKVRVTLEPGDFFIIITDGLIKQRNSNASQLGLKRVMDFLSRDFESPDAMVSALLAYANEFTGGLEKKEDISVLALKILR